MPRWLLLQLASVALLWTAGYIIRALQRPGDEPPSTKREGRRRQRRWRRALLIAVLAVLMTSAYAITWWSL